MAKLSDMNKYCIVFYFETTVSMSCKYKRLSKQHHWPTCRLIICIPCVIYQMQLLTFASCGFNVRKQHIFGLVFAAKQSQHRMLTKGQY